MPRRTNALSFREVARTVLSESDSPLTAAEITKIARQTGLLDTEGRTPGKTMYAVVTRDIKLRGRSSDFAPAGEGRFRLA